MGNRQSASDGSSTSAWTSRTSSGSSRPTGWAPADSRWHLPSVGSHTGAGSPLRRTGLRAGLQPSCHVVEPAAHRCSLHDARIPGSAASNRCRVVVAVRCRPAMRRIRPGSKSRISGCLRSRCSARSRVFAGVRPRRLRAASERRRKVPSSPMRAFSSCLLSARAPGLRCVVLQARSPIG